jgi:hypothetical protein
MYNYIGDNMGIISRLFKKNEELNKTLTQDEILEILIKNYNQHGFDSNDYAMIIRKLNDACISCGSTIDSISLVHIGQDAIILECNNIIIKITNLDYGTNTLTEYIGHSNNILKPITEQKIEIKERKVTVLTQVKLNTEKIKPSDSFEIYCKLRDDGYLWYDQKKENLGKDENGNLLLFDYGQLTYIKNMEPYLQERELDTHKNMFPELNKSYEQSKEFEAQFSGKKK